MSKSQMFSNIKPPKKNTSTKLLAEDKDQYIYFNPDGEPNTYTTDSEIQIIPNHKAREILYVTGPSGSGKSYYCAEYVKKFVEIFPESDIFLFSRKDSDPAFDKIKEITRIKIDDKLVND
jgi:predicted AAA+ superfamily ATPase